jgi:phosphohistidine phosphatase SixA
LAYLSKFKELESIMIVGHQPDLGHLASALLGVDNAVIEFKKGALCAMDVAGFSAPRSGTLLWHLQSKHLRALT